MFAHLRLCTLARMIGSSKSKRSRISSHIRTTNLHVTNPAHSVTIPHSSSNILTNRHNFSFIICSSQVSIRPLLPPLHRRARGTDQLRQHARRHAALPCHALVVVMERRSRHFISKTLRAYRSFLMLRPLNASSGKTRGALGCLAASLSGMCVCGYFTCMMSANSAVEIE
jgi:hypothetical protein